MINFDDFARVEMKTGTILSVEEIPGSEKLWKLQVDFGEEIPRQVLSGIKQWFTPKKLIGKQFLFVTNLEPRTMMGLQSDAMLMGLGEKKPALLKPTAKIPNGTIVR